MKHKLGMWVPFRDRKCDKCGLSESQITVDCFGSPLERTRLAAFQDGLCNYVAECWVDWTGRPAKGGVLLLRQRYDKQHKLNEGMLMADINRRHPTLKRKMAMEDELLAHSRFNHWNSRPYDD